MQALHASVSDEIKAGWRVLARRAGRSESELLRQAVAAILAGNEAGAAGQKEQEEAQPKRGWIRLEFKAHELVAIEKAANQLGWKRNTWLVSQVRAHLFREPRTTEDERSALMRSNAELRAIGRNLNQIARALHRSGGDKGSMTVQRLCELCEIISRHADRVNALLEAAENRWPPPESFGAETSGQRT